MMFTRKECRLSIYHLDENGSGRDQLFVGMEDLQKKGIMVTADQYRCVYSSLYLPNEDMNAIYSILMMIHQRIIRHTPCLSVML